MPVIKGQSTRGVANTITIEATNHPQTHEPGWAKITTVQGQNDNHYIAFVKLSELKAAVAAII